MSENIAKQLEDITSDVTGKSYFWGRLVKGAADEIRRLQSRSDAYELQASRLASRVDLLTSALQSIAANTFCGSCQEAALVARKALGFVDEAAEVPESAWVVASYHSFLCPHDKCPMPESCPTNPRGCALLPGFVGKVPK